MDATILPKIREAATRSIDAPGRADKPLPKTTPKPGENFVVVFRHGESEDNANRVFSGWRDSPLTDQGREQARALAPQLLALPLNVVVTSDLIRSKETAKLALGDHRDMRWEEDWRIKERDYGDLAGESKEAWMRRDPERTVLWRRSYDVSPPNGESLQSVETRVRPLLDALVERVRRERINVALSAHGNSMRAIRRYFEHMDIEGMLTHENPLGKDYALYVISDEERTMPQSHNRSQSYRRRAGYAEHHASTCRWAVPTLFVPVPFWWEAEDRPWTCVRGAPRTLETTEVCADCPYWEPRTCQQRQQRMKAARPVPGRRSGQ
jgi:2,3-bisphosphoglycerate-dependent phosphoglycerate mutase